MKIGLLIASLFIGLAAPAGATWQKASSRHFIVYSDDDPEKVAAFATKLERFDKALRVMRGLHDEPVSPMARVVIYVVPNIDAVQKLAGKRAGSVAGYYIPRASQSVAFVPRRGDGDMTALSILLHEYSHHFMFANWTNVAFPAWLVEGFAEFTASSVFRPDGSVLLGAAPQYRAFGIRDDVRMPLKTLLTFDPNSVRDDALVATFYARSWLLTHYMTLDSGRRAQLAAYFAAIGKGQSTVEAAKLLGDPDWLDVLLTRYARSSRLNAFVVSGNLLAVDPVDVQAITAGEAAIMPAQLASTNGVDAKTAPGVAALARTLAAPFPDDPAVQNELAEAEYDAGNWAAAEAAADRALAADPASIHAMLYRGMASAGAASAAKATDPAKWAEARRWYAKANRLDPEYAWPLMLYYSSYGDARQAPTASAQKGLLYAQVLAPFDSDLGMTAASVLLKQGKSGDAAALLKRIAYDPHAGGRAKLASAVIAAIDKGDATAAKSLIDGPANADGKDKPAAIRARR